MSSQTEEKHLELRVASDLLICDLAYRDMNRPNSYYCCLEHPQQGGVVAADDRNGLVEIVTTFAKRANVARVTLTSSRREDLDLRQMPILELERIGIELSKYLKEQNVRIYLVEGKFGFILKPHKVCTNLQERQNREGSDIDLPDDEYDEAAIAPGESQ